jgi:GT2 family glycosyltransferase
LELNKNIGYAGGNNAGIQKVLKEGESEYVVILNNDVKVESDWLSKLIRGFDNENVGICTSKILLYYPFQRISLIPKGDICLRSIKIDSLDYHTLLFRAGFDEKGDLANFPLNLKSGEVYNFAVPFENNSSSRGDLELTFSGGGLKVFIGENKLELASNKKVRIELVKDYIFQNAGTILNKRKMTFDDRFIFKLDRDLGSSIVDAGCGAAMAVRAALLERLGSFNDKYFMYSEDTELSYRFARTGFVTKFIPDAICYHYFWGSSGGKVTARQTFYGTRNRLWFIRRYFGFIKFVYFYLRTVFRTIVWGIKSLYSSDSKMFFKSYLKALIGALGSDK